MDSKKEIIESLEKLTGKRIVLEAKSHTSMSALQTSFKAREAIPGRAEIIKIGKWEYELEAILPKTIDTVDLLVSNGGTIEIIYKPVTEGADKGKIKFEYRITDGIITPSKVNYFND